MDQNDIGQARIHYIRVTNGLDFPFTDRHDGVPVTIQPGKSENLPTDMAAHFFGPNVSDQVATLRHISKRNSAAPKFVDQNPETALALAAEFFAKFKIEPVMYKLVAVDPDPREPVPADPEVPSEVKRGPGRPPKSAQSGAAA
jgi:hypothetical protein